MAWPDAISNIYHFILLPPDYMITCIIEESGKRQKLFRAALSFPYMACAYKYFYY